MLTIHKPIELKCADCSVFSRDSFANRILGNYQMMTGNISKEDLLHVVTEPAEVFLAQGDVSTLVLQTNVQNQQENKLQIMNQLMNRISMENTVQLTYQDRVYITGILHKLGVTNVNRFMHQVELLKNETTSTEELVNHYQSHYSQLKKLIEDYRQQVEVTQESQTVERRDERYLHQEIFNRLETGKLYQTIMQFYRSQNAFSPYLRFEGVHNAEYYRIAQNIQLNQLQNQVRGEQVPLTYRHENVYEESFPYTEEITEENITSQLATAVLLQLADNIYQSIHHQLYRKEGRWFQVAGTLYTSAENTIKRMRSFLLEQKVTQQKEGDYLSWRTENVKQEIALLNQIFEAGVTSQPPVERQQFREQLLIQRDVTNEESTLESNTDTIHTTQIGEQVFKEVLKQQVDNSRTVQNHTEQETLIHKTKEDTFVTENYNEGSSAEVTIEQLQEYHRHNLENRNKYIKLLESLQQAQEKPPSGQPDLQRIRKDGLLALTNPELVLQQLKVEGKQQEEEAEARKKKQMELLPEDTRRIFEAAEQQMKGNRQPSVIREETERNIESLIRDIRFLNTAGPSPTIAEEVTGREYSPATMLPPAQEFGPGEEGRETELLSPRQPERQAGQTWQENPANTKTAGALEALIPYPKDREQVRRSIELYLRKVESTNEYYQREETEKLVPLSLTEQITLRSEQTLQQISQLSKEAENRQSATGGQPGGETGKAAEKLALKMVENTERQLENQEQEQLERTVETTTKTRQIMEKWEKKAITDTVVSEQTQPTIREKVNLTYKTDNQVEVDEEVIQQLLQQSKSIENRTKVLEEVTQKTQNVERRVVNQTTKETIEQTENLTEMINRGVQTKISEIADQVYSKLERRLQNERKRRGY